MESLGEILAGIVGGLVMAACVIGLVRVVQIRRRRRRAVELGMDADERRFKRRLERQMQEIDDIFGDVDEEDEEAGELEGGELDETEVEQLKLLEQEIERKGGASAGTPSSSSSSAVGAGAKSPSKGEKWRALRFFSRLSP